MISKSRPTPSTLERGNRQAVTNSYENCRIPVRSAASSTVIAEMLPSAQTGPTPVGWTPRILRLRHYRHQWHRPVPAQPPPPTARSPRSSSTPRRRARTEGSPTRASAGRCRRLRLGRPPGRGNSDSSRCGRSTRRRARWPGTAGPFSFGHDSPRRGPDPRSVAVRIDSASTCVTCACERIRART